MAGGKGFLHDFQEDINRLHQLLEDSYPYDSFFAIVKEVVQNADDAGATHLRIGVCEGVQGAKHPLLPAPAVFFANNAALRADDEKAIRHIGSNTKAGEEATVGKFGLGLKGVFHLAEAFFYIYHDENSTTEGDVLNPWSADFEPAHPDWDEFAHDDRELLINLLRSVPGEPTVGRPWFCLWVPLRRQDTCGGVSAIVERYFDDTASVLGDLRANSTQDRVAALFPMLRSLEAIDAYHLREEGAEPVELFRIAAEGGFERTRFAGNETPTGRHALRGTVRITSPGQGELPIHIGGSEDLRWTPELEEIRKRPDWPSRQVLGRGYQGRPEKAFPHAAVYLAEQLDEGSGLVPWRSVFQPLGDHNERPSGGEHCPAVGLYVHGYWFVDAGRRMIAGLDRGSEDDATRGDWNRELDRELALPLLPVALEEFVQQAGLEDSQITALTKAVQQSQLYRGSRAHICAKSQWAYILDDDGGRWRCIPGDSGVVEVPEPPESDGELRLGLLKRALAARPAGAIALHRRPCLLASDQPQRWSVQEANRLLESFPVEGLEKDEALEYLVDFVEHCGPRQGSHGGEAELELLPLLARRLMLAGPRLPKEPEDLAKRFRSVVVGRVPSNQRLLLDVSDTEWEDHHDALGPLCEAALSRGLLVIPKGWGPSDSSRATVEAEVAEVLLREIARLLECLRPAGAVLEKALTAVLGATERPGGLQCALQGCRELRLFAAADAADGQERLVSYDELVRCRERGLLFAVSREGTELVRALANALDRARVLTIGQDMSRLLFGSDVKPCRVDAVAKVLAGDHAPALAEPARRAELLLQCLAGGPLQIDGDLRPALRYLLHGRSDLRHTGTPLYVPGEASDRHLWAKVARLALEAQGGGCQVPPELDKQLSPEWRGNLGVTAMDREGAIDRVREAGPERLDFGEFAYDELDQLVLEWPDTDHDLALLRRLRIHRGTEGGLHAIDDRTYWQGDFRPGEPLPDGCTVLSLTGSGRVRDGRLALCPRLTPKRVIEDALGDGEPQRHWRLVLEALAHPDCRTTELGDRLRSVAWVPLDEEGQIAPDQILSVDGCEEAVSRMCPARAVSAVHRDVREHEHFEKLKEHFVRADEAIAKAVEFVADDPRYHLGIRVGPGGDLPECRCEHSTAIRRAFGSGSDGLAVVCALLGEAQDDDVRLEAIRTLGEPVADGGALGDRAERVVEGCKNANREEREASLELLEAYLRAVVDHECYARIIGGIELPSQHGYWKSTRELCIEGTGIDRDSVVEGRFGDILRERIEPEQARTQRAAGQRDLGQGSRPRPAHEVLADYFREWETYVDRPVIGALLAVLGDDQDVVDLAEGYLGTTVDVFRSGLDWRISGMDWPRRPAERMRQLRIEVRAHSRDTIRVQSVSGSWFEAVKSDDAATILVGGGLTLLEPRHGADGWLYLPLTVRRLAVDSVPEERLVAALRSTFELVLDSIGVVVKDLDGVWERLRQSQQRGIEGVRERLLRDWLPLYLSQLGVPTGGRLKRMLREREQARRECRDLEAALEWRDQCDPEYAHCDEQLQCQRPYAEQLLEELCTALDNDADVQSEGLEAIRRRVSSSGYELASIPFELFQNADDAVAELEEFQGTARPEEFVVQEQFGLVRFVHWGRSINQYAYGTTNRRDEDYDADLEKMLVLNASEKPGARYTRVTGKFGLGFKSVFLATDEPRVLSGRLGFQVVCGFWPQDLPFDDRLRLEGSLGEDPKRRGGTVIELPLRPDLLAEDMLRRFRSLSPIQVALARRIRCIRIEGGTDLAESHWRERRHGDGVCSGALRLANSERQALVLRARQGSGALLLVLDAKGFAALPDHVPGIWVTTPTRECEGAGFVVNGDFELDTGRQRLAVAGTGNADRAQGLGRDLGERLRGLEELVRDDLLWKLFSDELALACDQYGFWDSLFDVLVGGINDVNESNDGRGSALLRDVLWGEGRGLQELYTHRQALPSGLPRSYRRTLALTDVCYVVGGVLAREKVLERVCAWPEFSGRVEPGHAVSGDVWDALERLDAGTSLKPLERVCLADAVRWELEAGGDLVADSPVVRRLGAVVTEELMESLEAGSEDWRELRDALAAVRMRSRAGTLSHPRDLLPEDEARGLGVRQPEHIADVGESPEARGFFGVCRGPVPFQTICQRAATWRGAEADTDSTAAAEKPPGIRELARSLNAQPAPPSQDEARATLEGLSNDWEIDGRRWEQDYDTSLYWGRPLMLRRDDCESDEQYDKEWLKLFLLGMCHRMGRTKPEQHRGFIDLLEEQHWLDEMVRPGTNDDEVRRRWIAVLDGYISHDGGENRYYEWMRNFVGLRWVFLHLPEYRRRLEEADKRSPFRAEHLFRPRDDTQSSGTGAAPPHIDRVLGIGACFVLRELVRSGIISTPEAYPYCYVPSRVVRSYLAHGLSFAMSDDDRHLDQSKAIHGLLAQYLGKEGATFGGAFDLPLIWASEKGRGGRDRVPAGDAADDWE